jgi:hypothetical protein
MTLWVVIAASVLLVAVVSLSLYGASALPEDAELPMHYGLGGFTNWRHRTVVLWTWPAISGVLYVLAVAGGQGGQAGSSGVPLSLGMTIAIAVLLINQIGALRASLHRSGRRRER